MKLLYIITFVFFYSFLFSQNVDVIDRKDKQIWKDSVYLNRFNEGNIVVGGMPMFGFSGGKYGNAKLRQFGLHSEFGFFIKHRLLLYIDNVIVYNKLIYKPNPDTKQYTFYDRLSPAIRYYLRSKRFTLFAQSKIGYTYTIDYSKLISSVNPSNFHIFNTEFGVGMIFSANRLDISLALNYVYPFYHSDNVSDKHIKSIGNTGVLFMPSIIFILNAKKG